MSIVLRFKDIHADSPSEEEKVARLAYWNNLSVDDANRVMEFALHLDYSDLNEYDRDAPEYVEFYEWIDSKPNPGTIGTNSDGRHDYQDPPFPEFMQDAVGIHRDQPGVVERFIRANHAAR